MLVMLCSMRSTKIAKVEGLWLVNRPKCSVLEDPDDSPEVWVCSPFIVASLNSIRDLCDIISWHHNCLLWSSSGKTTACAHWKHCHLSAYLPASTPESPNNINASEPLCLFLNLISMSVTLSTRYFGVPSHWSLNLFTHSQQNTGRHNKQTRMMDATYWLMCILRIKIGK